MNQSYAYTPLIWLSVLSVLLLLALAVQAWRHRRVAGALPFAIGGLFATFWAAGSVMEFAALDFATKLFWFKAQTIFQLPATVAITCFVLEYAWPGRWLTRRNLAILSIGPLLVIGLTLTNKFHHLMWINFEYENSVIPQLGLAGKLFIIYAFGLGLLNLYVFSQLFVRSPQHRWPVAVMAFGQLVSRTLFTLEMTLVVQIDLPLDMFGLVFTFLMYIIALFGFRLFDPIPLAIQMVITQMRDGMLVLDLEGRLTTMNPAAKIILGTSKERAIGQLAQALLPGYANEVANLLSGIPGSVEICLGTDLKPRYYEMVMTTIKDWREVELGHLLLLRDVTLKKQAQSQIIEQQRSLATLKERWRVARDLHDNIGQVIAFVNTQGQAVRRLLSQGDVQTADAQVARLVEAAREADVDIRESIMALRVSLPENGFFLALEQYLATYEKMYAIQTKLVKPETFDVNFLDALVKTQLLGILQEALTNVRKHANASRVEVKFEDELGWVNVTVIDDGRGFEPSAASEVSSEHFGLRVMTERAEEIGSILSLHSEPGHGTQVRVRVPIKEATQ
ncbi:MAG TPA: histidine kinase N-terminal 7TM domain-containing protein [Anaerolineaceae bacterium]|nr:histidine kinase N-terminal 7TM domain-containing protein [Anaerolineaceae bacterium]